MSVSGVSHLCCVNMECLDAASFISEVQRRPAIWNTASDEYANIENRKRAWEGLVDVFINKEDPTSFERAQFAHQLQRRWKSFRNCYSRELKLQREGRSRDKSGREHRRRSVYAFYNQLSFLKEADSLKDSTHNTLADDLDLSSTPPPPPQKVRKKIKRDLVVKGTEVSPLEYNLNDHVSEMKNASDCDLMFLLSLLSPLKQIPEWQRFGVKRRLMDVLDAELQIHCKVAARSDRGDSPPSVRTVMKRSAVEMEDLFYKASASTSSEKSEPNFEPEIVIKEEPIDLVEDDTNSPQPSTSNSKDEFILPCKRQRPWTPPAVTALTPAVGEVFSVADCKTKPETAGKDQTPRSNGKKSKGGGGLDKEDGQHHEKRHRDNEVGEIVPVLDSVPDSGNSAKDHRPKDQFDAYAEYIAAKLRKLDWKSCAYVQKAIGDIIFEAEMGKYKT